MRKSESKDQFCSKFFFRNRVLIALVQFLVALNSCSGFFINHQYSYCTLCTMSQLNQSNSVEDASANGSGDHVKANEQQQPTSSDTNSNAEAAVEFARLLGRLKVTPRTGWVRRGVPEWESVADHSWRVAALSLLLPHDFDVNKCIAMGVLHDVAEALVGDICPEDNISKQDKARMETEATEKIAMILSQVGRGANGEDSSNENAQQMLSLLHEYEERESKEAIGVKDLDLLDMIIQAGEYEERFGMDLREFFDGTPVDRFRTPAIKTIAQEVHGQRRARVEAQERNERVSLNRDCISESDASFVEEFAKASSMPNEQVEQVVKAMRAWDKKSND